MHCIGFGPLTSELCTSNQFNWIILSIKLTSSGVHLWPQFESESNDVSLSCFSQQKSVARKKCAACKIVVHSICIEQLEKVSSGSNGNTKVETWSDTASQTMRVPPFSYWIGKLRLRGRGLMRCLSKSRHSEWETLWLFLRLNWG